jgi:MuDR family transposase
VNVFRIALNHYAITKDFEYDLLKSGLTCVIARFVEQKCNWKIHASVAGDGMTFIVKSLQPDHIYCGVTSMGINMQLKVR